MLRWIFVLGLVLVGAAWMLDGWTLLTGEGSAPSVQEPVAMSDPEGATAMPRLSVVERPPRREPALPVEPAPPPPGPETSVDPEPSRGPDRVAQARALIEAGTPAQALELLRQGMVQATTPREQAEIALALSGLEPDLLTRRRLIGRAIRGGAVTGDEWERVGESLRQLGRNPRASLYDGLDLVSYTVRPNDSLWKLCNQTFPAEYDIRTEAGLLRMVNGMSGDGLHPGQTLLVPRERLSIEVDRVQHGLVAWLGELPLLAYRIGLGKEGRTPTGNFVVEVKQEQPDWYTNGRRVPFGDPENVLGTRWMGFENSPGASGYGIHGTDKPESVGKNESMGCVRMRNHEVEELFEVVPRGTVVSIP